MNNIHAISFIANDIQQYHIIDGDFVWVIKKVDKSIGQSESIGQSSVANRLNSILNIKEINGNNLYSWLDKHVPLSKTTALRNKKTAKVKS